MKKPCYTVGCNLLLILTFLFCACGSGSEKLTDNSSDSSSNLKTDQFVTLKCTNGFIVKADFSKCDPKNNSGLLKLEIGQGSNISRKVDLIKDSTINEEAYLSKDRVIKFIKSGFSYKLFSNDSLQCTCINPVRVHNIDVEKGKSFVITEDFSKSDNEGYLSVDCIGFENASAFDFGNQYPIDKIELADLNGDGSKELYIITKSPIGEENAGLCVLMSIGNSINQIDFDLKRIRENNKSYYKDFAGYDSFTISNNQVIHSFTEAKIKFKKINKSAKATVNFNLIKDNTSWVLKPVSYQTGK